jgi:hypothetical protein
MLPNTGAGSDPSERTARSVGAAVDDANLGDLRSGCAVGETAVKARALIGGASYDPDTLKVLYQAFDDAWEQIAPEVADRSAATYAARMKLAETILGLARNGARDVQALTDAAVQTMLTGPTKLRP